MTTLRIVQLTDIHLLAGEDRLHYGVDTLLSLQRVLASIAQLNPRPDLLILSSDLAEDGAADTYHLLAEQLQELHIPVYYLPGNHDDVAHMKVMDSYSNIHPCKSIELGNWGFYFANGQVRQHSHGLIGTEQLSDIKQYLNMHRDKSIVLCMHHPSFEACPAAGCQLQDAQALHEAMAEHKNLRVILAGHTHDDKQDSSKAYAQFTTPSCFAYAHHDSDPAKHADGDFWSGHRLAPEKISYRSLDLNDNGSFSTQVHWVTWKSE